MRQFLHKLRYTAYPSFFRGDLKALWPLITGENLIGLEHLPFTPLKHYQWGPVLYFQQPGASKADERQFLTSLAYLSSARDSQDHIKARQDFFDQVAAHWQTKHNFDLSGIFSFSIRYADDVGETYGQYLNNLAAILSERPSGNYENFRKGFNLILTHYHKVAQSIHRLCIRFTQETNQTSKEALSLVLQDGIKDLIRLILELPVLIEQLAVKNGLPDAKALESQANMLGNLQTFMQDNAPELSVYQ